MLFSPFVNNSEIDHNIAKVMAWIHHFRSLCCSILIFYLPSWAAESPILSLLIFDVVFDVPMFISQLLSGDELS